MTDRAGRPEDAPPPLGAACPVCGAPDGRPVRFRELMFGTREVFEYRICETCGAARIVDVPEDLARHYPPAYYSMSGPDLPVPNGRLGRALVRYQVRGRLRGRPLPLDGLARRLVPIPSEIEQVEPYLQTARIRDPSTPILDVGCGSHPTRLAILRDLGFDHLLGIDPFIDRDLRFHGVEVRRMTIDAVDGRFGFVMLHHSLEHIATPLEVLRAVRRLLPEDGCVLIRTPLMGSGMWTRYGSAWAELDPPRHLVLHTLESLQRLTAAADLVVDTIVYDSSMWEFVASEQYANDLAMFEAGSWFVDPIANPVPPERLDAFRQDARRMNADGTAGRAALYLRPRTRPSP